MFTELAIKRAIEGGWVPKEGSFYDTPWRTEMANRWLQIKPKRDAAVQRLSYSAGYGQGFGDGAIFLDKNFWQCLGKTEKWEDEVCSFCGQPSMRCYDESSDCCNAEMRDTYLYHWHSLIDNLAQEKSIEEFFKSLLKE